MVKYTFQVAAAPMLHINYAPDTLRLVAGFGQLSASHSNSERDTITMSNVGAAS